MQDADMPDEAPPQPRVPPAAAPEGAPPVGRKSRTDLFDFLHRHAIATTTVEHPALHTVDESRALRGEIDGGHTKNLFVKDKKGTIFLIVAEETRAIDLKTLHRTIGAQGRLSFASPDQMRALLGVEPGSVTAFGVLNDGEGVVRVVLDAGLLAHERLNCHPLTNEATTTIGRDDLLAFFAATGHVPLIVALEDGQDDGQDPGGDGVA